jgi:Dyp-type peroxidase family
MLLSHEALADIQGIITTGYGHLRSSALLFMQLVEPRGARAWLEHILPQVTSAAPWPKSASGETIKPQAVTHVAFTRSGLEAIGLPRSVLCSFPLEFQEGMADAHRSTILGDTEESAPQHWELGGPNEAPIHVLLLLHAASRYELDRLRDAHRAAVFGSSGAVLELRPIAQEGYRLEGDHEPFGFHDGMSQPEIRGVTGAGVPTGEFILGYENHYGFIPPTPVVAVDLDPHRLLPDFGNPHHACTALRDLGFNGSFLVYRKLRQHVAGFWRFMQAEAQRHFGSPDPRAMVWIASRLIGRWPGGAPLAVSPERDDPALRDFDAFLYAERDRDGFSCPVGAHVRRANPRDAIEPYEPQQARSMTEAHRLLRRGSAFGRPLFDPTILQDPTVPEHARALLDLSDDGDPRGLHFFCVNASIRSQFEFVQQSWCNNPRFSGLRDNKDPVIGDNERAGAPESRMRIPHRPLRICTVALPRFVTVRGGAYFFLPSMRALRFLASGGYAFAPESPSMK